ncbi:hypothetical protein VTG60DRAFT_6900 [Thermothelomyces hinnuleus]
MADSIRGDDLLRAGQALQALVENPERLERARARFCGSPTSYTSQLSGATTLSHSPDELSDAQKHRDEKIWYLKLEHRASLPYNQFDVQSSEELHRLFEADRNRTYHLPPGIESIYKHADSIVRERWIEQGIWKDKWNGEFRPGGLWKHEEPLESETETGLGTAPAPGLFGNEETERRGPAKSEEELRQEEREREASRPYYHFLYQVSKERERIQGEMISKSRSSHASSPARPITVSGSGRLAPRKSDEQRTQGGPADGKTTITTPADINSIAYERVECTWIKRQIWNTNWGVLPGMSWKHEQPFEEMLREQLGDDLAAETEKPTGNQPVLEERRGGGLFGHELSESLAQEEPSTALKINCDGASGIPRPHLFRSVFGYAAGSSQSLNSRGRERSRYKQHPRRQSHYER